MSDIGNLEKLMMDTKESLEYGMGTWAAKFESALESKDRQIAGLARRRDELNGTERPPMTP